MWQVNAGVPYGNRTRVAAVKEKRFTVIQRKPAAWIGRTVLKGTLRTRYWTLNGLATMRDDRECRGAVHQTFSRVKYRFMIQKDKMEELLKLPIEERRRVLRL